MRILQTPPLQVLPGPPAHRPSSGIGASGRDRFVSPQNTGWYNLGMSKEDVQAHLNNRHDVDAVDKLSGDTALTAAAWNKQDEMVAFLLDKNARVGHQDHYGNTALMGAVWNGQEDLVKLLLGKGARINQKNIWGGKRP